MPEISVYNMLHAAPVDFRKTFVLPRNAPIAPGRTIRFSENYVLFTRKLAKNAPGTDHHVHQATHHPLNRCHSIVTGLLHSIFYKKNINTYIHLKPPMERVYRKDPPVTPGASGPNP